MSRAQKTLIELVGILVIAWLMPRLWRLHNFLFDVYPYHDFTLRLTAGWTVALAFVVLLAVAGCGVAVIMAGIDLWDMLGQLNGRTKKK